MLLEWLYPLSEVFSVLNVIRYITFRTASATVTALVVSLVVGPAVIRWLSRMSLTQQIRDDGPKTHLEKAGTPTAGGIIILGSIVFSLALWGNWRNVYLWILTGSLLAFGAVGLWDDYLKISRRSPSGLSARRKFALEILIALVIGWIIFRDPADPYPAVLSVPFFKHVLLPLGILAVPFSMLVITGSANAVNLTDGIDGLAIGLVGIASVANALLVYVSGHSRFAAYLQVLYLPGAGELTVFCGAMLGAALGFLWFNSYPAQVFMGDVGSLSLGGALGTLAVITKQEIVLAVVGGIFVAETVSVIAQVASFKLTGKRIFRMAPLHHHFELKGWHEPKVIVRFWIVGILLAFMSLMTLKLR